MEYYICQREGMIDWQKANLASVSGYKQDIITLLSYGAAGEYFIGSYSNQCLE